MSVFFGALECSLTFSVIVGECGSSPAVFNIGDRGLMKVIWSHDKSWGRADGEAVVCGGLCFGGDPVVVDGVAVSMHIRSDLGTAAAGGVTGGRWCWSSWVCSGCGVAKTKRAVSGRENGCEHCGLDVARDVAARVARTKTAGSGPVTGRGAGRCLLSQR